MYKIGDLILYGSTGVCRVNNIVAHCLPGAEKEEQPYYVLKPLYQDCIIFIPVNANKVFMRPIISKNEANRLIDMIPFVHAEIYHTPILKQLAEHYEDCMKTYDCADLIELTMSLYAKKKSLEHQKRKFGVLDERYMRRAENLLFGELAAALGIPKNEVPDYIDSRVNGEGGRNNHEYNL